MRVLVRDENGNVTPFMFLIVLEGEEPQEEQQEKPQAGEVEEEV